MIPERMLRVAAWKWTILFMTSTSAFTAASGVSAMDCSKARTPTEKTICGDPELEKMDRQLNRDYRSFLDEYQKKGNHDCLLEDETAKQKAWLKERDACGTDVNCIKFAYADRSNLLRSYASVCVVINDASEKYLGRACYKPALPTAPTAVATSLPVNQKSKNDCSPGYKIDFSVTKNGEGDRVITGYIPGYYIADVRVQSGPDAGALIARPVALTTAKARAKAKKAAISSGVTIDTGLDLAQQSESHLHSIMTSYVKGHGVPVGASIDRIFKRVRSFLAKGPGHSGPQGEAAYHMILGNEPKLTRADVELMRDSMREYNVQLAERNYNLYNKDGKKFQELPAEAQTLMLDVVWNFGGFDDVHGKNAYSPTKEGEIIQKKGERAMLAKKTRYQFWTLVYANDWKRLAEKLKSADFPLRTRSYDERYRARGRLLDRALQRGWPDSSAC
ncbi:pesticin C-terminus-like muramidase [Acidithiobacillus sp. AC3]